MNFNRRAFIAKAAVAGAAVVAGKAIAQASPPVDCSPSIEEVAEAAGRLYLLAEAHARCIGSDGRWLAVSELARVMNPG